MQSTWGAEPYQILRKSRRDLTASVVVFPIKCTKPRDIACTESENYELQVWVSCGEDVYLLGPDMEGSPSDNGSAIKKYSSGLVDVRSLSAHPNGAWALDPTAGGIFFLRKNGDVELKIEFDREGPTNFSFISVPYKQDPEWGAMSSGSCYEPQQNPCDAIY
eukprot:Trichotokara_eunicae@DN8997_c0_g1_i1.p1